MPPHRVAKRHKWHNMYQVPNTMPSVWFLFFIVYFYCIVSLFLFIFPHGSIVESANLPKLPAER